MEALFRCRINRLKPPAVIVSGSMRKRASSRKLIQAESSSIVDHIHL